jgi:hypothetical protein
MIIENYNMIYNNYCISYLSHNLEIPIILLLIRKNLEEYFPELKIFYGFNKLVSGNFNKQKNIIDFDFLINNKKKFGCIYDCKENFKVHPLTSLILDTNINLVVKKEPLVKNLSKKCLIIESTRRTTLNSNKLKKLKEFIISKGYEIVNEDYNVNELGCIAGLESPELYLGAYRGLETILVEDSYCKDIYKKIFPENIIFSS